jgi:hypothetical protein
MEVEHLIRWYKSILKENQWLLTPSIETMLKETIKALEGVDV